MAMQLFFVSSNKSSLLFQTKNDRKQTAMLNNDQTALCKWFFELSWEQNWKKGTKNNMLKAANSLAQNMRRYWTSNASPNIGRKATKTHF